MGWGRLDDGFIDHPKLVGLRLDLVGLWAKGLGYCGKHLTDGLIRRAALYQLATGCTPVRALKAAGELVDAGLWEVQGEDFLVHDYLDWNPSADKVRAERDAARARMRGLRNGHHRPRRSPERSAERSPVRSPEQSAPFAGTSAARSPNVRDSTPLESERLRLSGERSGEHQPRSGEQPPPALGVNGLPELPAEVYHRDCPEIRWRGSCVDRAYLAEHPEIRGGYPTTPSGEPKSCPAHRGAV